MICNYLNLEQKVARGLQRTPVVPHSDLPAPSPSVYCVPRAEPAAPRPLQVEPQLHGDLSGSSRVRVHAAPHSCPQVTCGHYGARYALNLAVLKPLKTVELYLRNTYSRVCVPVKRMSEARTRDSDMCLRCL